MKSFILVSLIKLAISDHEKTENVGKKFGMDSFNSQIITNNDAQTIGSWGSFLKPSGSGTNGQIIAKTNEITIDSFGTGSQKTTGSWGQIIGSTIIPGSTPDSNGQIVETPRQTIRIRGRPCIGKICAQSGWRRDPVTCKCQAPRGKTSCAAELTKMKGKLSESKKVGEIVRM